MKTSRRKFVGQAAALSAGAAMAAGFGGSARLWASTPGPSADRKLIPSEKELWDGVVYMNNLGVRFSGSAAHQKFVKYLEDGFSSLGMQLDPIEHKAVTRWDVRNYSLSIASGANSGRKLPVASYCRYSKTTGPDGVTGQLVYCGKAEGPSGFSSSVEPGGLRSSPAIPGDLTGKIALVEVVAEPWPYALMYKDHVRGVYNSDGPSDLPTVQKTATTYGVARLPMEWNDQLKKSGAAGVIYAYTNLSDDSVSGQMKGGSEAFSELWVGPTAGAQLRQLATDGGQVKMVVEGDVVPDVPTHTIVATLPGATDETIILWTHTDGNNAIEENGGVATLNLMKYFAKLPQSSRKRTITCVMSEAHFNEQYIPTNKWVKERPELIHKAVAEVAIEHLGCGEWVDDAKLHYHATGDRELGFAFCPQEPLADAMLAALEGTKAGRIAVIDSEVNAFSPAMWGYRISKVPIIAYISAPPYLLAEATDGYISKLSSRQFYEQTVAFANVIHRLDGIPKSSLPGREGN